MWRKPATPVKTANLCNQFLVEYLLKKKTQLQKIGMQRKAFVYHAAISSIRKYPLPIISPQQLKSIHGVGELLGEELITVIKIHYKDFLKKNQQTIEVKDVVHCTQSDPVVAQYDEEGASRSVSKSLAHTTVAAKTRQNEDDSKSQLSIKSATIDRQYKPRANTLASFIMLTIRNLGGGEFVSQQLLKQGLKQEYNQNAGKQYVLALANLIRSGLIHHDPLDQQYLKLSEKGIVELERLENKTKVKQSQAKIQNLAISFRENRLIKASKIEREAQKIVLQAIATSHNKQLVLLIDNRQKKDQQEQCFFQTRLQDKHGIICRSANLPIGDFIWLYDNQVLDYVVQRKKADDLIGSIFDGRYKEQKYRLKNSGFSNIYYLFQGHLTGTNATSEREVASALLKTRVKDEFKVVAVRNISESLKFLAFMTTTIQKKLTSQSQINTLGTLQELNNNNGKSSNLTVQQIFGLSLKTIPGVGKGTVSEILKYFPSFKSLYNQLKLLSTPLQRIEFLREVLRGSGVNRGVPQLLVDVLFANSEK